MREIKFPKLFEPGHIGKLKLKNRIIFPPVSTNFASVSGEVNERIIKFYTERARGGAGLIIIENICIDYPAARHGATQLRILIGDAREPRKIINAIEEGFLVGNSI